ncbi:MAG TPA: D-sedoheptulose 7-phosphate isomerase [Candidatus Latescibacteria bacterium]|nr:D-sedoheptulose 7-phosphate isomerase [Candidatus Latescibacterota bacterium]
MIERIRERLLRSASLKEEMVKETADLIARIAELIIQVIRTEGKVLLCGNGGSAADCQHFAGEMVGRFRLERKGIPVIALSTDTSVLTAISNDYGFETVFARQVEALGRPGDLLIAFSTSGSSPNVLRAVETARKIGMSTVGFTGGEGGKLKDLVDVPLIVPAEGSPLIQEGHLTAYHIVCELVEEQISRW